MDLELTSKRAIVTGGRRGIGRAIAAARRDARDHLSLIVSSDGERTVSWVELMDGLGN